VVSLSFDEEKSYKKTGFIFCNFNQFYFFTLFHAKQKKEPFLITEMNNCHPIPADIPLKANALNTASSLSIGYSVAAKERGSISTKMLGY